jgi:hypothetical protein
VFNLKTVKTALITSVLILTSVLCITVFAPSATAQNTSETTSPSIPSTSSLIAYWQFDENSGATAADSSGNGNTATLANNPAWVNGVYGKGIEFDGSTTYVTMPNNIIRNNNPITISVWFKTTSYGPIMGHANVQYPSAATAYMPVIYVGTDGKLRAQLWNGWVNPITSDSQVNDGNWYNVVLVVDKNTQSLYLKGTFVGTLSGDIDNFDMIYNTIGMAYWNNGKSNGDWPASDGTNWGFFKGVIDEVQIYNAALTSQQIQNIYNNLNNATTPTTSVITPTSSTQSPQPSTTTPPAIPTQTTLQPSTPTSNVITSATTNPLLLYVVVTLVAAIIVAGLIGGLGVRNKRQKKTYRSPVQGRSGLPLTCSVCGTVNPTNAEFCLQCGARLKDNGETRIYQ